MEYKLDLVLGDYPGRPGALILKPDKLIRFDKI